jgi:hypothetical protein
LLTQTTLLQNFLYLTAMQLSPSAKQVILPFVYLAFFFGIYTAFTNATIYHATLSHVIKPYKGLNNMVEEGRRVDEPYEELTNKRLQHWDARTYYQIGEYGYYQYYTTAFFPLFPLLFKLTGFSWLIIIINFLLFALSLRCLFRHLGNGVIKDKTLVFLLLISLPSAFVFLIPYSEALFFGCFTISIAGFLKGNKYLLFTGLLLAATTRPIVTIVLLSIVSAEVIRLLYTRKGKALLNSLVVFLAPMLAGTFIAADIQYLDTGSFFNFITVQKDVWDHYFRLPTKVSDWSEEGHTLNIFTLLFIVLPAIWYCYTVFIRAYQKQGQLFSADKILSATVAEKTQYLTILSSAYIVGSFLFILFFQGGSLNGTFRYIMCTPFFYILIIAVLNKMQTATLADKKKLLKWLGFFSALFLIWTGVHNERLIKMVEFSFVYLVIVFALLIFSNQFSRRAMYISVIILAFLGLIYQTYLFNSFLTGSWILT